MNFLTHIAISKTLYKNIESKINLDKKSFITAMKKDIEMDYIKKQIWRQV